MLATRWPLFGLDLSDAAEQAGHVDPPAAARTPLQRPGEVRDIVARLGAQPGALAVGQVVNRRPADADQFGDLALGQPSFVEQAFGFFDHLQGQSHRFDPPCCQGSSLGRAVSRPRARHR
jgi:hypothetical protein